MSYQFNKHAHADPLFTYTEDGEVVDLSSAELYFILTTEDDKTEALIEKENTAGGGGDTEISWYTDGSDGKYYLHLTPADWALLENGTYWYCFWRTEGGKDTEIGNGICQLVENYPF